MKDKTPVQKINFNGKLLPAHEPIVAAQNRGLRYGDGLFETMKLVDGRLLHASLHFERLFHGLELLGFEWPRFFTAEHLSSQATELAEKNGHNIAGRIRLTVVRGDGGLYDAVSHAPNWIIETMPAPAGISELNSNGLVLGVFEAARKTADTFSALKTNNFLPYLTAALQAKKQHWNDALVLNAWGRVADSTIANLWWQEGEKLFTPPLSEGPVAGTVRRRLLERLPQFGWATNEVPADPERLMNADAMFLTNAMFGLRWVGDFNGKQFGPGAAAEIFKLLQTTI